MELSLVKYIIRSGINTETQSTVSICVLAMQLFKLLRAGTGWERGLAADIHPHAPNIHPQALPLQTETSTHTPEIACWWMSGARFAHYSTAPPRVTLFGGSQNLV